MSPTQTISRCGGTTTRTYAQVVATISATKSLVALWRLNEGSTPYADTSGFLPADPANLFRQILAVPMTQNYTPAALSNGQDAFAVAFNADHPPSGTGDYLQAVASSATRFTFSGTTAYSLAAWVLPFSGVATSVGGVITFAHLTGWAPPAGTTDGYMLGVNQPAQTPYVLRYPNTAYAGTGVSATGAALSLTAWHFLVGTYDGANLRLYVDGSLSATTATVAALPVSTAFPTIGAGQDTTATTQWFYGAVSEAAIWGAALSAADISNLWIAGTS